MYCPYCLSPNTEVANSRLTKGNAQVWRRRQCLRCKEIFTTHEIIDLSHLVVVKKSGKTQKFSRTKLYSGIYGATIGSKTNNREFVVDKITREVEKEKAHYIRNCRHRSFKVKEDAHFFVPEIPGLL